MSDSYTAWCEEESEKAYKKAKEDQAKRRKTASKRFAKLIQHLGNKAIKLSTEADIAYQHNDFGIVYDKLCAIIHEIEETAEELGIELNKW